MGEQPACQTPFQPMPPPRLKLEYAAGYLPDDMPWGEAAIAQPMLLANAPHLADPTPRHPRQVRLKVRRAASNPSSAALPTVLVATIHLLHADTPSETESGLSPRRGQVQRAGSC